jgi:hypothetical protein
MAKITSIQPSGNWRDLFKFEVSLDNGVTGTVFAKTESLRFGIGDEVAHELNEKGTLKLQKPEFAGSAPMGNSYVPQKQYTPKPAGKDQSQQIARSVVFKGAVDLIAAGKMDIKSIPSFVEEYLWVVTGEAPKGRSHQDHFSEESPF